MTDAASGLPVKIADGTTPTQIAAVDSSGRLSTNIGSFGGTATTLGSKVSASSIPVVIASDQGAVAVSGTVAVTGVATAANQTNMQVADNAAFTDGTTVLGMAGFIFDETAGTALTENDAAAARIDAKRAQVFVGEDATTRGQRWAISAAGALAGNLTQVGGSTLALGQAAMAASIPVVIASNQTNVPANITQYGGTNVVTGGVAGTVGVGGLAASGATLSGNPNLIGGTFTTTQPTVTNGQVVNLQTTNRGALMVAPDGISGFTVDTELPAAAALSTAFANPTAPAVGAFGMGWNGTNWDRLSTANTGRLQVDVITGGGSNASILVDNAAFTDGTSSVATAGYIFDEVAGTALTENDVAAARIDSKRAIVNVLEDATTRGQRASISAAGALAANITQVGGATHSATVPLFTRMTDGTAVYAKTGQTAGTAAFAQLSDQTTAVAVIVGVASLKTDLSSVAGAVPSATNPVPVRLSDGAAFYAAASGAPTLPKFSAKTSSALGAGSSVDLTHYVTSGKTGRLAGIDVTATVPLRVAINTEVTASKTVRVVLFTQPYMVVQWRPPFATYITQASADATSGFSVTIKNMDSAVAADVYSTGFWDEV